MVKKLRLPMTVYWELYAGAVQLRDRQLVSQRRTVASAVGGHAFVVVAASGGDGVSIELAFAEFAVGFASVVAVVVAAVMDGVQRRASF